MAVKRGERSAGGSGTKRTHGERSELGRRTLVGRRARCGLPAKRSPPQGVLLGMTHDLRRFALLQPTREVTMIRLVLPPGRLYSRTARSLALAVALSALLAPLASPAGAQELTESRRIAVARRLQRSTVSVVAGPSTGSGFVVGDERWIITNAHVIEPAHGRDVQVRFGSGVTLSAHVVELDRDHDLAILEVRGRVPSPPLELGNSDDVEVGQTVLAFGSPFGLDGTLTQGIVSARRDVPGVGGGLARRLIQTDAPINPGNSGGPLVDRRGRVVGVNTAIYSRTGGSHGIGFAVPANYVGEVLGRLRAARRDGVAVAATTTDAVIVDVTPTPTPTPTSPDADGAFLGAQCEDWSVGDRQGVRLLRVVPGSGAHRAGLLGEGDPAPPVVARLGVAWSGHVITAIDGTPVRSRAELEQQLSTRAPGDRVRLSVIAGGLTGDTEVTLGTRAAAARDRL